MPAYQVPQGRDALRLPAHVKGQGLAVLAVTVRHTPSTATLSPSASSINEGPATTD